MRTYYAYFNLYIFGVYKMKINELVNFLSKFDENSEVRLLVNGEYLNIEEVIQGRFFSTVELLPPQSISIEQAEGELVTSTMYGTVTQNREKLIIKAIGQARFDFIKNTVEADKKARSEVAVVSEELVFEDEEVVVEKPKKKGKKKKLSDEEKLLNHFSGEELLEESEVKDLRKKLGAEKVREIFSKV